MQTMSQKIRDFRDPGRHEPTPDPIKKIVNAHTHTPHNIINVSVSKRSYHVIFNTVPLVLGFRFHPMMPSCQPRSPLRVKPCGFCRDGSPICLPLRKACGVWRHLVGHRPTSAVTLIAAHDSRMLASASTGSAATTTTAATHMHTASALATQQTPIATPRGNNNNRPKPREQGATVRSIGPYR